MKSNLVRSLCTTVGMGFALTAFSGAFVTTAHADAEWQFAGAYTEDGYTYNYSVSGNATANLLNAYANDSAQSTQGESVVVYATSSGSYTYYPAFAWTGPQAGNPNSPLLSAAVYANGEGSATETNTNANGGGGMFSFGLSTPNNQWYDGGTLSSNGYLRSPNMYLSISAVSANLSFSTDYVSHSASVSASASTGPRGDASDTYSALSAIGLGYITVY